MEKTWLFFSVLFAFFVGALAAPCPLLRAPESAIKTGCYICVLHDDTSAEKFDEILQNSISYADGRKVYGSVQTVIKAFTLKLSAYSVARVSKSEANSSHYNVGLPIAPPLYLQDYPYLE